MATKKKKVTETVSVPTKVTALLTMQVTRIRDEEVWSMPKRAFDNDAGLDLTVSRYTMIYPGNRVLLPHNMAIAIPEGFFGLILPRSSTFHSKGLIIHPGVIDSGFRNEVMTIAFNPGTKAVYVGEGERISQLLIHRLNRMAIQEVRGVDKLPPGDRGKAGFGSTGGFGGSTPPQ